MSITADRLRNLLTYDPLTGVFVRKTRPTRGAGAPNGFGHIQIRIDGVLYMAHRLAWLYVYGEWPASNLDHVNGRPADNRINNLRLATPKQNQENTRIRVDNSSGCRGVTWHRGQQRWVARVQHHKIRLTVGSFDSLENAIAAVKAERDLLYTHNKTEYAS